MKPKRKDDQLSVVEFRKRSDPTQAMTPNEIDAEMLKHFGINKKIENFHRSWLANLMRFLETGGKSFEELLKEIKQDLAIVEFLHDKYFIHWE